MSFIIATWDSFDRHQLLTNALAVDMEQDDVNENEEKIINEGM